MAIALPVASITVSADGRGSQLSVKLALSAENTCFHAISGATKLMDVQPILEIRPGYKFNVLVNQDIVFPDTQETNH